MAIYCDGLIIIIENYLKKLEDVIDKLLEKKNN
jgi:hypothetical protein